MSKCSLSRSTKFVRTGFTGLAAVPALMTCSTVWARAPVATALIREGQNLGGGQIVNSINNPAVNHLVGWGFQVNTTDTITTLSHFFGNPLGGAGAIMLTEGTYGNYTQTSFESFWGMSNSGQIAYSPIANDTVGGFSGLDGVWVDGTPIAVERQPFGGLFWSFGSRPGITADGNIYWCGGTATTAGGATSNRGLFYGNAATTLLLGGQNVPGLPRPLISSTFGFDYRMSAYGTNYIHAAQMTSPTADDIAIVMSGSGLMAGGSAVREATVVPFSVGGNGVEAYQNFDFLGVTESGDYLITGDTNAATTADEFIMRSGQIVYRDGMVIDGVTVQGDIEAAYMNENADIAYIWDINANTQEALFLNDMLLIREGDEVDWDGDGVIDAGHTLTDFTGISSLALTDRDLLGMVSVYFTADIITPNGTLEGGFTINVLVPSPGALPLLAMACLIGGRRRRA